MDKMRLPFGVFKSFLRHYYWQKLAIVTITLILSCSNKEIYEAVQQNRLFECEHLPLAQYEDCMEGADGSYESYVKDREDLINSDE